MENNQNINKKKKKHYHFNHKKTNIAKETVSNDLKEEANNSNIKVSEPKNIIKNVKSQKVNNVVKPNGKKEDNNIKKNDTKKIQNTQKPNNVVKKNEPKKDNSQKQSNIKADVSVKSGNKSQVEKSNQIVNNNVKEKNIKQDNTEKLKYDNLASYITYFEFSKLVILNLQLIVLLSFSLKTGSCSISNLNDDWLIESLNLSLNILIISFLSLL